MNSTSTLIKTGDSACQQKLLKHINKLLIFLVQVRHRKKRSKEGCSTLIADDI